MWNNRIAPAILLRLGLSESVSYSKQEFITQAVELITHSQKRQALRGKVSALSFQPLFNTSEAKGYIPAFRVAYVATLAQPRLLAQYPSVAGVGYEECILYVLTALPSLTSIPNDSELQPIAEAICYDLLYPLQPAEVNMYGGPLRNGPPIQIPQHMV